MSELTGIVWGMWFIVLPFILGLCIGEAAGYLPVRIPAIIVVIVAHTIISKKMGWL